VASSGLGYGPTAVHVHYEECSGSLEVRIYDLFVTTYAVGCLRLQRQMVINDQMEKDVIEYGPNGRGEFAKPSRYV
jgi:hypothetical protein